MKKILTFSIIFLLATPFVVSAQTLGGQTYAQSHFSTLNSLTDTSGLSSSGNSSSASGFAACADLNGLQAVGQCTLGIINAIIPIIMAATVVLVIWGSFNLIKSDDADRKKYGQVILWGIVGLFIMVSVWGLVNILTGTFQFGSSNAPTPVDVTKL